MFATQEPQVIPVTRTEHFFKLSAAATIWSLDKDVFDSEVATDAQGRDITSVTVSDVSLPKPIVTTNTLSAAGLTV